MGVRECAARLCDSERDWSQCAVVERGLRKGQLCGCIVGGVVSSVGFMSRCLLTRAGQAWQSACS
jgi:hypothetical protein